MTALSDRIAEVLREHRELRWSNNSLSCSCESNPRPSGTAIDYFTHVAERIEAALLGERWLQHDWSEVQQ